MCYVEYNLPFDMGCYIAEGNDSGQWCNNNCEVNSTQVVSLEDEIQLLRSKMELLFSQEKSFTSDIVIEISSLLDLKINEFMRSRKNR
ncbi:hypothetical protein J2T12_000566 [Paenibacillus anaericanus]|nr:aspartyl-phosphate phosphatase Spo0E family protein [Paenibacillus anaericanus]MDQ0087172.1 hypothetical protein [Paenibacillus anaericanus]